MKLSFADEWLDLKLSCEWFKVMNILKMKLKWGVGLKAVEREMKKRAVMRVLER